MKKLPIIILMIFLIVLGSIAGKIMRGNAGSQQKSPSLPPPPVAAAPLLEESYPVKTAQIPASAELAPYKVTAKEDQIVIYRVDNEKEILFSCPYAQNMLSPEEAAQLKKGFEAASWEEAMMIAEAFAE